MSINENNPGRVDEWKTMPDASTESGTDLGSNLTGQEAAIQLMRLTDRQRELLALVSEGIETSKSLARETGLSPATIDNHLSRAARVLSARNRKEAAKIYGALTLLAPAVAFEERSAERARGHLTAPATQVSNAYVKRLLALLHGPPIGGREPEAGWLAISLQVIWVAFVGLTSLGALTLFVLAFYKTFG